MASAKSARPVVPFEAAGSIYRRFPDIDVIGCRVCLALRELFSFDWSSDPARLNRVMDEGGCYPASPDVAFARIEAGEDFSLFRIIFASADLWPGEMPALWFRNSDMMVEGSNAPD